MEMGVPRTVMNESSFDGLKEFDYEGGYSKEQFRYLLDLIVYISIAQKGLVVYGVEKNDLKKLKGVSGYSLDDAITDLQENFSYISSYTREDGKRINRFKKVEDMGESISKAILSARFERGEAELRSILEEYPQIVAILRKSRVFPRVRTQPVDSIEKELEQYFTFYRNKEIHELCLPFYEAAEKLGLAVFGSWHTTQGSKEVEYYILSDAVMDMVDKYAEELPEDFKDDLETVARKIKVLEFLRGIPTSYAYFIEQSPESEPYLEMCLNWLHSEKAFKLAQNWRKPEGVAFVSLKKEKYDKVLKVIEKELMAEFFALSVKEGKSQSKKKVTQKIDELNSEGRTKHPLNSEEGKASSTNEDHIIDVGNVVHNTDQISILLGRDENGKEVFWEPEGGNEKEKIINGNILITGASGSGKTETFKSILYELNKQGFACLVLSFHSDLEIDGFDYLKINPKGEVGVNPLDFDSLDDEGGGLPVQVFNVLERLESVYPNLGTNQRAKMVDVLTEAYRRKGITEQEETWRKTCPNFEDVEEILKEMSEKGDKKAEELKNKFVELFTYKIFSRKKAIDTKDLLIKSTVIDVSKMDDKYMFLVADTIIRKVYRELKLREAIEYGAKGKERFRIFIGLDEAKIMTSKKKDDKKAIINILATEARKYGVGFIVASQQIEHFGKDIVQNTGTKIALMEGDAGIAKANAKNLSPITAQDLMNIKRPGEAFIHFSNEEKPRKILIIPYALRTAVE